MLYRFTFILFIWPIVAFFSSPHLCMFYFPFHPIYHNLFIWISWYHDINVKFSRREVYELQFAHPFCVYSFGIFGMHMIFARLEIVVDTYLTTFIYCVLLMDDRMEWSFSTILSLYLNIPIQFFFFICFIRKFYSLSPCHSFKHFLNNVFLLVMEKIELITSEFKRKGEINVYIIGFFIFFKYSLSNRSTHSKINKFYRRNENGVLFSLFF